MKKRWPGWVYDEGQDPDYRFSFANERTFLAWIRTSLALLAAGVAVDVVDLSIAPGLQIALTLLLVTLALISAVTAWLRWALAERAIRNSGPLPTLHLGGAIALALVVAALMFLIVGL